MVEDRSVLACGGGGVVGEWGARQSMFYGLSLRFSGWRKPFKRERLNSAWLLYLVALRRNELPMASSCFGGYKIRPCEVIATIGR